MLDQAQAGWLKAVFGDGNLSPMARLLASVIVTQFSHREVSHCALCTKTLADALGTSGDTIKRALRDLAAAGWMVRPAERRGGRCWPACILLTFPDPDHHQHQGL